MTILSKNAIFRPKTELEAIARWSVDASREVDSAYFGNIGRNSEYFLLPIFLGSYLTGEPWGFVIVGGKDQVIQYPFFMKSNHSPGPYCQAGPHQSLL